MAPAEFVRLANVVETMNVNSPRVLMPQFRETVCGLPLWTVPSIRLQGERTACRTIVQLNMNIVSMKQHRARPPPRLNSLNNRLCGILRRLPLLLANGVRMQTKNISRVNVRATTVKQTFRWWTVSRLNSSFSIVEARALVRTFSLAFRLSQRSSKKLAIHFFAVRNVVRLKDSRLVQFSSRPKV